MLTELIIENEALRAQNAALVAERDRYRKLYERLATELALLQRQLFGQKAEKVDAKQMDLALLPVLEAMGRLQAGDASAEADAEAALEALRRAAASAMKPKGDKTPREPRKLKLEDLEVVRVVIEPPERKLPGGELLEQIGEEVSEHVDRRAARLVRVQVVRPKYKTTSTTPGETKIFCAEMPERPVPKSIAGPGLLAHTIVSKYADHIPLHRQEIIYKREGLRVARSTLCDWVAASASLVQHIVDAMWEDTRDNARYALVDATGVLVQAEKECKRAHFYVVVVPQHHVLYRFTTVNDGAAVAEMFSGFSCYFHADAAAVYHELYRQESGIIEVGCWAHARRGFFEALATDRERALVGIGFIGLLYDAQRAAMDDSGRVDKVKRADASRPILARIFSWARHEFRDTETGTKIDEALGYLVRQRRPLRRFLEDGMLRLDNNPAELNLRREVVGRKNWLFVGSDNGAAWNTAFVSLIASCQMHNIEPWAYLRDVLMLLPDWRKTRAIELAPKNWRETLAKPATQALLDELRLLRDENASA
ncbi:MAG: IS66 family transposase [Rhodocyclales bacterium]|nr:IS66 family transposase [Rhodocyclales bacterium]